MFYTYIRSENIQFKKFQTGTNGRQLFEMCILFLKNIIKHKDDRRGGGYDR